MMNCKRLRETLDLYVDHELAPDAMVEVDAHITECAACRSAVEGLLRLRGAVRKAVETPVPPRELLESVRSVISPPWYHAAPRWAIAATLVLATALALLVPGVRGKVATGLDYLSFTLDNSRQIEMEGTLLCRDQQLQKQYGYPALCRITGHHGWLVTADGRFWSILEGSASHDLIHDSSLLGRRVIVQGRLFRRAGSIEVNSFQIL
ncbi:MAG: hypothetical protein A3H94_05415 [Acidobacteria bacterium RIFCSPLOWO2_02_FULL_60_20]|nr:MAG: hypothetical protein A3H94_05415 [Acidobacteria bacterium RIFCSPLOWO2_02_FULL_60_20]